MVKTVSCICRIPFFEIIRILFRYTAIPSELCWKIINDLYGRKCKGSRLQKLDFKYSTH